LGGPGYTLNRAALKLFGSKINKECTLANNTDSREDIFIASCFFQHSNGKHPILVTDTRDADGAFRYLPKSPNLHGRNRASGFQLCNKNLGGFEVKVGLDSVSNQSVAFHLQDTVPKSVLHLEVDNNGANGDIDSVSLRADVLEESIYRHHALLFNLCNW